jgi:arabinogalactan oligomer/maltooligosaccharide transport system permease protein
MTARTASAVRTAPETRGASAASRKSYRRGRRSPGASVALHLALILASLIAAAPVVWVVLTSFKPNDTVQMTDRFGALTLQNYRDVLQQGLGGWMLNSVIVALGTMVFGVFIAATSGYAVSRMRFPGSRPLMWLFLVVQMFPVAVLIVPMFVLLKNLHLLNNLYGLVLVYATTAVPFCAWMLKGYFDGIPTAIDEAGRIDGLSPFGTFWRLIVPVARPGLAVTAFYTFLTAWGEVAYATQFLQSPDKYTLPVGMQTFVNEYVDEWGPLAAGSVLIIVPAAAVFFVVQRHLVAGLTAGTAKG